MDSELEVEAKGYYVALRHINELKDSEAFDKFFMKKVTDRLIELEQKALYDLDLSDKDRDGYRYACAELKSLTEILSVSEMVFRDLLNKVDPNS